VDLPTYTNIWRIEKRLYKLYDFRLPMPLPINWIAVFAGITIPYVVLLIAIGLPFNHSLVALYILPPGVLTWLTTRPVIESKRLPELVESQVRYLTEPRTWVRLAPLSEKDQITVTARIWHSRPARKTSPVRAAKGKTAAGKTAAVRAPRSVPTARRAGATTPAGPVSAGPVSVGPVSVAAVSAGAVAGPLAGTVAGTVGVAGTMAGTAKPGTVAVPVRAGHQRSAPGKPGQAKPKLAALGLGRPRPAPALPPSPAPQKQKNKPQKNAPHNGTRPVRPAPTATPVSTETPLPTGTPVPTPTPVPTATPRPGATPTAATSAPAAQPPTTPRPATTGKEQAEGLPVRGRGGPPDVASLEVSHDRPRRSGIPDPLVPASPQVPAAPPVPSAPATRVIPWPAPDSPLRQAGHGRLVGPVPDTPPRPPVEATPEAAAPAQAPQAAPAPAPSPEPVVAREPAAAPEAPQPDVAHEAAAAAAVTETQSRPTISIERALSGPARDRNLSWHGKVKIVTGAGATAGPGARDQEALDRNRARLPIAQPKRILVLGCTSGAGQTVTALMTAAMLASLREHPVAAVDLHDGALAAYREPAAGLRELLAGKPPLPVTSARPDGLHPTPKPNPARLDVIAGGGSFADGDEIKLAVQLNRHYPLAVLDPGAAGLTKLLKVTDQLVLVAPASADAAGALADTREWLDNNGHADLAMQSVTVINGASRRSLADVEQAESIARGRSRAIVRVPWDDMLPGAAAGPSALRPQTRVAYTALAGVLVAGMAAAGARRQEKR
jgi:TcpE family